jgi:hypothetical protein
MLKDMREIFHNLAHSTMGVFKGGNKRCHVTIYIWDQIFATDRNSFSLDNFSWDYKNNPQNKVAIGDIFIAH